MHRTGSPNKVIWATRSEVLGLRSPTIEFLKLLFLPVLLESPNNGEAGPLVSFQRRTGGSGNCPEPELEGETAVPGTQAARLPAEVLCSGDSLRTDTNSKEVLCPRGSRHGQVGEAGASLHSVTQPFCGPWNLRVVGFWNHGI